METVGTIREIWRYPVKSMAGEPLDQCVLGARGLPGDRAWALRDEEAGEIRGAKKMPPLMQCRAHFLAEPEPGTSPPAEIALPDGTRVRSDQAEASERLSALVGRRVTLCPLAPDDQHEHYRRAAPETTDPIEALRDMFSREEDEPLPDISVFPPELMEFTSPLGTYFDAFPLHLVTTAWLEELGRRAPAARFDVRRFRPNFLVETAAGLEGFVEAGWIGKQLAIGEARIRVEVPCVRCGMTTHAQDDLPKSPEVLRTIVRESDQNVGAYATITAAGAVRVGDSVSLI